MQGSCTFDQPQTRAKGTTRDKSIKESGFRLWFRGLFNRSAAEIGVAFVELDDAPKPIGVLGSLVPADALDSREAERVTAGVASRLLDLVAGNLQDQLRL